MPNVKLQVALILGAVMAVSPGSFAQMPAESTLILSLKTMSKALGGCRANYERVQAGTGTSLVKALIGDADYQKDVTSLEHAETFVNVMAEHPERITGKSLVAALSSTDDFYAGVGSTRLAILGVLISPKSKQNPPSANELLMASTMLADCQAALFNAGDDFVDLVMNYVGAEDDAFARLNARPIVRP